MSLRQSKNGESEERRRENTRAHAHRERVRDPTPQSQGELLEELNESDIKTESDDPHELPAASVVEQFLSRDFILGNVDAATLFEWKMYARNIKEFIEAEFPPQESVMQGAYRKAMLGDPMEGRDAMDGIDSSDVFTALMAFQARGSRSRDGWQQDKIADQRKHVISESREDKKSRTLFGGED
jgi:hypothetical protein